MKLDKIKFARLISFIGTLTYRDLDNDEIEWIDRQIDIEAPIAPAKAACADVDELLRQLNAPDGFIPVIKAYRVLTGAGLKESKEAIERYRNVPKFTREEVKEATLSDILNQAIKK